MFPPHAGRGAAVSGGPALTGGLFAFSRPALTLALALARALARAGQLLARRFQAGGAAQYGAAMRRAVQEAAPGGPDSSRPGSGSNLI